MSRETTQRQAPNGETAITTKNALGDQAIVMGGETAVAATAGRATAIVQAKIMQALARPRKLAIVRERLKEDCQRPTFAKVARYARPQGNKKLLDANGEPVIENGREVWVPNIIDGWSIRFVEAAVQAMGNAEASVIALFEDEKKKIVRNEVWDLERNISWSQEVTVEKTIERSKLKRGQVPLATRKNSYGEDVYVLPASADETRLAENRIASMTLRTLGLRIVPGDILDEMKEIVEEVREKMLADEKAGIVADPTKARKDLLDRLAKIGIRAADVIDYLGGKSVESATPDMILELRIIGAGVQSGDILWRDALAGSPYRETPGDGAAGEDDKTRATREKIEAKLKATKEKKAPAAPAGAPPGDAPPPAPEARPTPKPEAPPAAEERQPGAEG